MTKRRALWAGAVLVAVLLPCAVVGIRALAPAGSTHRITPYTVLKVRLGMTRQDVQAIFRVPPGDYSSKPDPERPPAPASRRPGLQREEWTGEGTGTFVFFGPDGRVADWQAWVTNPPKPTWLDRIEGWLPW
jgi:hypothetical protein